MATLEVMQQADDFASKTAKKLVALGNWIGAHGHSLLLLDLENECVITGSPALLLALGTTPISLDKVLTPAGLALIRCGRNDSVDSPIAADRSDAPSIWQFEVLIPGELGLLVQQPKSGAEGRLPAIAVDTLTGLLPRHLLASLLEQRLVRFHDARVAFAVLFLDLDDFKQINDRYGHLAGDEVLRAAAAGILHTIRPEDRAIRFGGDEFVILIGALHTADEAVAIARRVRAAANTPIPWRGEMIAFTASTGIAFVRDEDRSGEAILERADRAMYRAKSLGRCGKIELD